MTSVMSKRHQARNEKSLQDLVHSVPGNNFCADCQARNPVWASWSLGVFLCMRCAAIHRKLGTHISKVKSLSMDSWSNEQVENMRKVGNVASNKNYNPQNKRPPVPVDADEADPAMERFIRQKYVGNSFAGSRRSHTGSTASDENPPPLPPKTPSKFSLRSATSIFPHRAKKDAAPRGAPTSPAADQRSPQSPHRDKPSKALGARVGGGETGGREDTESKLARLRDMGFTDDQRNAVVLKGMHGNLERAVETLVRLGEGGGGLTLQRQSSLPVERSITPASPGLGLTGAGAGLTVPHQTTPLTPSSPSNNPFDMVLLPPAPVQSAQSTGTLQNKNPYYSTNPFGLQMPQGDASLDQALHGLSLSPPPPPLFPHHTGGAPAQVSSPVSVYQQSMTPPLPSMPQNYASMAFNSHQTYPKPQPWQPMHTGSNPFFNNNNTQLQAQPQPQPQFFPQQQQYLQSQMQPEAPPPPPQQQQQQPSLTVNTGSFGGAHGGTNPFTQSPNPFTKSPMRFQSPTLGQIPEQSQQNFYGSPQSVQMNNNPFFTQPLQQQQQQQQYMTQSQQPQRADKASIMALYSQAPLASPPLYQQTPQGQQQPQQLLQQQQYHHQQYPQQQAPATAHPDIGAFQSHPFSPVAQPVRSASFTAAVSKNPFLNDNGGAGGIFGEAPAAQKAAPSLIDTSADSSGTSPFGMGGPRSRESVMASGLEWMNGRHSPDAFASLSARDLR